MKRFNTMFAIVLTLIIGLGSVTATAHTHTDHQESGCSVSVLQHSSAAVATDSERTFLADPRLPKLIHSAQAVSNRTKGRQLARAPPLNL